MISKPILPLCARRGRHLTRRVLCAVLLVAAITQSPLFVQGAPSGVSGEPAPPVPLARRRIVFALDQSSSMDALDPQRVRIHGVRKLLHGLTPTDEAGLVLFGDTARIAVPLGAVTPGTLDSILLEAEAAATGTVAPDLNHALDTALGMVAPAPDGVMSSVVLISSARMAEGEDADATALALRSATDAYTQADVGLYVIALGPFSAKARALASILHGEARRYLMDTGNDLPRAFARVLPLVLGYSQRLRLARLDPDADSRAQRELSQTVRIGMYAELLQIDIASEADSAGVIPFSLALEDPRGETVAPTLVGVGNAFYRIPFPMHGDWRYGVRPARKARMTHGVITDNGLNIVHYCPSAAEVGKAIALDFAVLTPQGEMGQDRFTVGAATYQFDRAEVTVARPDGESETIRPDLAKRRSRYAAEYGIADWRADVVGSHRVDVVVYVHRAGDPQGDLFAIRNRTPIRVQVVDDRSQLPLVSLASVAPTPADAAPIPPADNEGKTPELAVRAEVLDPGIGVPSPNMLGRTIAARVEYSDGYELVGPPGGAKLTGDARQIGPPALLLESDTTVARRIRYAFPTPTTDDGDRVYFERRGYYYVQLVDGPTYRVDPDRRAVIRHVGRLSVLRLLGARYEPPPDLRPLPRPDAFIPSRTPATDPR